MGVPSMFRWLSQKYPEIVSRVIEDYALDIDGMEMPVDRTKPNPNGEEFDNLYLDMNGIVHPCSHPEDKPAPKTEKDMMLAIFEYTDRVVGMVRPRKLLYMAVDGVAPRAKMNQQRSRRFRSAKEAAAKDAEAAEFQKMLKAQKLNQGEDITTMEQVIEKTWDSNAITPGTPFMWLLAQSLRYWCAYKFTTDPSWKDMKVIISDASVPGEGEHKIMNFIRSQRAMATHDPNTRHVLYGLDADLIMLGLATHEPHFRILREDVFYDSNKKNNRENRFSEALDAKANRLIASMGGNVDLEKPKHPGKPYIWLHVNVLREYLAEEMQSPYQKFPYDLERALDDWVFMCFFVGNDFLPHLPSLEIRDKGIELLIGIWRELVPSMSDYVTRDGFPDMHRVQKIMRKIGDQEAGIFRKRKLDEDRRSNRDNGNRGRGRGRGNGNGNGNGTDQRAFKRVKEDTSTYTNANLMFFAPHEAQSNQVRDHHRAMWMNQNQGPADIDQANRAAAAAIKAQWKVAKESAESQQSTGPSTPTPEISVSVGKRKADAVEEPPSATPDTKDAATPVDTVQLWENGYQKRYYEQKFHRQPDEVWAEWTDAHGKQRKLEFRQTVAREYVIGLCWVLAYYMQGCASWTWYYPYHYAPFAEDFSQIDDLDPQAMFGDHHRSVHKLGQPFKPYEQLMAVLPAASGHTIPEPFRELMVSPSPIEQFYPADFVIDLNGKKFEWQGVALLPFIDEKKLLEAMAKKYPELSDEEVRRNELGRETLMFSTEHQLNDDAQKFYGLQQIKKLAVDPHKSGRLNGTMEPDAEFVPLGALYPPFDIDEDFTKSFDVDSMDGSMRVYYDMPMIAPKSGHRSVLLHGAKLPPAVLTDDQKRIVREAAARSGKRHYQNDRPYRGAPLPPPYGAQPYHNQHKAVISEDGSWAVDPQTNQMIPPEPQLNPDRSRIRPPGWQGYHGRDLIENPPAHLPPRPAMGYPVGEYRSARDDNRYDGPRNGNGGDRSHNSNRGRGGNHHNNRGRGGYRYFDGDRSNSNSNNGYDNRGGGYGRR